MTMGSLVDPLSLSWQVYDTSTELKQLTPVLVASGTVNLVSDKLGTGQFVARYTPITSEPIGMHEIRWTYQISAAEPVLHARQPFEVGASGAGLYPYYCSLSDMRAEGVTTAMATDARLMLIIARASKLVEKYTGRFFEPRYLQINVDGNGAKAKTLGQVLIAIDQLNFQTSPLFPSNLPVTSDFYRVYNRHLAGQLFPDDRNNPKLELFSSSEDLAGVRPFSFSRLVFPRGQQNVAVSGVWGYTDPDGTPCGGTPEGIRRVTQLLVMRDLHKLTDLDRREDSLKRARLTSEGTRDQHYTLDGAKTLGLASSFTGDPEIDGILVSYLRPMSIGAA
jgi:hypothetical protein